MIKQTDIAGLLMIEPGQKYIDERGFFRETFYRNELEQALGQPWVHVQENLAHSRRNVLRGIHAAPWSKLIQAPFGEIVAVIVDLRPSSPSFKKHQSFVLSSDNNIRLFLPPGLGNSYCVISEVAAVEYQVDQYFKHCLAQGITERGVSYLDSELKIQWPLTDPIVSQKDQTNPTLEEFLAQGYAKEIESNINKIK